MEILSQSREETIAFGQKLAKHLKPGDIICLIGDLGSGKTTLVKGIAQGLGLNPSQINSPTFVLMNAYKGKWPLYHFDLYRLQKAKEVLPLDYEEYFYGDGIAVVEWAERLGPLLPKECLKVELSYQDEEKRLIKLSAQGGRWEQFLNKHITF